MDKDDLSLQIQGLEETQRRLVALADEVRASGGLEGIIASGTLRAHAYATKVVHVLTGRLKNSLHPRVHTRGNNVHGVVRTNVLYAPYEHARGGSHAFFDRTVKEEGKAIVKQIESEIAALAKEANG